MLKIDCIWCGPRGEEEFTFGGPSHIERPVFTKDLSDEKWANYLFFRDNKKGLACERWGHTHGCGQWFNMVRDSVSHEILAVYRIDEKTPVELLKNNSQSDKREG